jgi:hypothetical protein
VKIFSDAGIQYAGIEIPFYQEGNLAERVYDIEAYAHNLENGRIITTPLNLANVYTEKVNNWWKVRKFAIPNVKSGTVIEYRYKIYSTYLKQLRDWSFQWKIPVVYSEYEVKMIPFYVYNFILQGANRFDNYTSYVDPGLSQYYGSIKYNEMVHKYVMKNLPAFKEETYITSINDYLIKVNFQLAEVIHPNRTKTKLVTTWEKMNNDLLKHQSFGKYIKKSARSARRELKHLNLENMPEEQRMFAVVNYVKGNYHWNHHYGKYAEKKFRQFKTTRMGNAANLNLFLTGLLRAAKIDAHAVVISSRDNGKINSLSTPFDHYFNYTITAARINGKTYLLDATDPLVPPHLLPLHCINDMGLAVKKNTAEWHDLLIYNPSFIRKDISISITGEKNIKFRIDNISTHYDAINYRKNLGENPDKVIQLVTKSEYNLTEEKPVISDYQDLTKPFRFTFTAEKVIPIAADKLIISPFLNEPLRENPFKQEVRNYPVDYIYPEKREFNSTIIIPEGYAIDFLPENFEFDNNLMQFMYKSSSDGNNIQINCRYLLKKSIFTPMDYPRLKFYLTEAIKKLNQEIVLKPV